MNQKTLVMITVMVVLTGFVGAAFIYDAKKVEEGNALVAQNQAALEQFYSPRLGNLEAKVTIVEFMDPACETCAAFHPFVKHLLETYKGKLNLVIRYAPFHPGSDKVVKMLEAGRKQGMNVYWDMLELMFDTQEGWASHHHPQPEKLWEYLAYYKFDVARLQNDMQDPALDHIVATDLKNAKTLGVKRTPTYFVNGKPLSSFGYKQLQALVEQEITAHYP